MLALPPKITDTMRPFMYTAFNGLLIVNEMAYKYKFLIFCSPIYGEIAIFRIFSFVRIGNSHFLPNFYNYVPLKVENRL